MKQPIQQWVEINGIYRVKAERIINFLEKSGSLIEHNEIQQELYEVKVKGACLALNIMGI